MRDVTLSCPFCKSEDFDDIGLKMHLLCGFCDKFNAIPTNVPQTRIVPSSEVEKPSFTYVTCCGTRHKINGWNSASPYQYWAECEWCGAKITESTPEKVISAFEELDVFYVLNNSIPLPDSEF